MCVVRVTDGKQNFVFYLLTDDKVEAAAAAVKNMILIDFRAPYCISVVAAAFERLIKQQPSSLPSSSRTRKILT